MSGTKQRQLAHDTTDHVVVVWDTYDDRDPTNSPFGLYLVDETPDVDVGKFPQRFDYWRRGYERVKADERYILERVNHE